MKDKVVLITGAAGRIGSSLARAVLKQGWRVSLVDVDEPGLLSLRDEFGDQSTLSVCVDAGLPKEADYCLALTKEHFGRVDAAVHSAYPRSAGWGTPFEQIKIEHLDEDLTRHLGGAILFSQRMMEFFKAQGYGNLIHISSVMGVVTPKFENYQGTKMTSPIEYTAIKAALIAVTKYLAKYYKGNHIRVNCISPGGILDCQPDVFLDKYRSCCNDKGMLDVDDLVGSILFLLSDQSLYVTGQNLVIDDGWSL